MAVVAEYSPRTSAPQAVRLSASERRHRWAGEDALLIGFPASPDGTPWDELSTKHQIELAVKASYGHLRLEGEWTLVARAEDGLVIRTDPYGLQPLFVRVRGQSAAVAEELWPLLDSRPNLDPIGIADFLLLGHHLGSRTVFEDLRQTTGGVLLRITAEGVLRESSRPNLPEPVDMTLEEAVDAMEAALAGIYRCYRDVARLVVLLSGGLDSRVLAALAGEDGFDVHAWTFVLQRNSEEEEFARRVARELHLPQTISQLTPEDLRARAEEFVLGTSAQTSVEHCYAQGAEHDLPAAFSTAVNGIWGDVICGGGFLLPEGTTPSAVPELLVRKMAGGRDPDELQRLLPGIAEWVDRLRRLVAERFHMAGDNPRLTDFVYFQDRPGRFNVWPPLAMKRLHFINPFLNDDLIQVCYAMPERWHRGSAAYRRLIMRRWPALGRIPWEKTGRRVDRDASYLSYRIRDFRRWYGIGRPVSFVGRKAQLAAFGPLVDGAMSRMRPVLADVGIDVDGLIRLFGAEAERLRLRILTLDLILRGADPLMEAGGEPSGQAV
jgi:asparagine synthase